MNSCYFHILWGGLDVNELSYLALSTALGVGLIAMSIAAFMLWRSRWALQIRMNGIPDLDAENLKLNGEVAALGKQVAKLRSSYKDKYATFERLKREIAVYDERLAFAELGVYEPHFDFDDPDAFKAAIRTVRHRQKAMVEAKTAVICRIAWTVDGSRSKGKTMENRAIRLTLRAFNNECEAAIGKVRWNNANSMERRIENAAAQIDKANISNNVVIQERYVSLRLEELWLTHEYREAGKREKDERAEAAHLAREEQKLIRDAEKARQEEDRYRALLEKVRAEASSAQGGDVDRLQARIEALEKDLAEAHAVSERARSMAEMTRSGYVYVISNIGSFGEDMVKIGLTRRLDPDDRVRELGDASVPFRFDTHAMIYSDDAPTLEAALHAEFDATRVNAANSRKEFFRIGLEAVEAAVRRLAPDATFFRDREAQEYQETLARRRDEAQRLKAEHEAAIPAEI
jgi:hypothetical protein